MRPWAGSTGCSSAGGGGAPAAGAGDPVIIWRIQRDPRHRASAEDPPSPGTSTARGRSVRLNVNRSNRSCPGSRQRMSRSSSARSTTSTTSRSRCRRSSPISTPRVRTLGGTDLRSSAASFAVPLRPRSSASTWRSTRPRTDLRSFMRAREPSSVRSTRHRAAGLPPRLARGIERLGAWAALVASGRRHRQGAPREGRQPGDGDRRGRAHVGSPRRTGRRPMSTPIRALDSALLPDWAGRCGQARQPQPPRCGVGGVPGRRVRRARADRVRDVGGMAPAQARQVHAASGLLMYARRGG